MTLQVPLSRAEIMRRAGIPDDVLTFWSRRELIVNLPRRTPTARRYWLWYEANIGALMMHLRQVGVQIEGLLSIAGGYRASIHWAEANGILREQVPVLATYREVRSRYLAGDFNEKALDEYAAALSHPERGDRCLTPHLKEVAEKLSEADFQKHAETFQEITATPSTPMPPWPSYYWRVSDEWHFGSGPEALDRARGEHALSMIAIDVSAVLSQVWNEP